MGVKVVKKGSSQASGFTKVKFPDGSAEVQEYSMPVQNQGEPLAEVGIVAGQTMNLGNYNSARVSVSLKLPCAEKDLDETYERALAWVDEKMSALILQAQENGAKPTDEDPDF